MSVEMSVAVDFEPGVFTTTEAHRIAGVTVRQLWHWLTTDVITPSAQRAFGAGSNNLWSFEDLQVLSLLGELARLGAQNQLLQQVVPDLRRMVRGRSAIRGAELVVITREPVTIVSGRFTRASTLLAESPSGGCWVLDLRRLLPPEPTLRS